MIAAKNFRLHGVSFIGDCTTSQPPTPVARADGDFVGV